MEGIAEKLIDVLIAVVLFVALFGVILTSLNGLAWSTLNVAGTTHDFSWVPYILIILLMIGLVYVGYRLFSKSKK
jgi:hypothetical protein